MDMRWWPLPLRRSAHSMANRKADQGDQNRELYPARVPTGTDEIVLWNRPDDVRCVVRRYDEIRYQLRLLRGDGTIKSDLFADYSQVLAAALQWQKGPRSNHLDG